MNSDQVANLFFKDLRTYNSSNFKTLAKADIHVNDATVHKAFSSVITRYFIFREKHPELNEGQFNMLYYKLKLDLIAYYFSKYPDAPADSLVAFQIELNNYIRESKGEFDEDERPSEV